MMKRYLAPCLMLCMLVSCSTSFQYTAAPAVTGKTVAVICGTEFQATQRLASALSDELSARGKLKVISAGEPYSIKGPYTRAYMQIDEDYVLADRDAVMRIQEKTGADMVLVIWTPVEMKRNYTPFKGHTALSPVAIETVHVICQLYSFPGASETGHGKSVIEYISEDTPPAEPVVIGGVTISGSYKAAFREWAADVAGRM